MSIAHVGHADIARFADEKVNLKREDAKEYRDQVNRLRDRLEEYLKEHPDFSLRRMLLSGSLAKGTALKSINDADVAVYVSKDAAPGDMGELRSWLAAKIRDAFPNFKPEQVEVNPSTLTVSFVGTGLRVDVVPILYDGDPNWKGHLVSKAGDQLLTSIPMHIEFIRKRKNANQTHYAQIIRLLKYWVRYQKSQNQNFRFKSFMLELLVARLADQGYKLNDYPEALAQIFAYIAKDAFRTDVVFGDNYNPALCVGCADPIRIWDPVNHQNNTANRYDAAQKNAIIEAALEAGDAIDSALYAQTKADTLRYWRKVFGPAFEV